MWVTKDVQEMDMQIASLVWWEKIDAYGIVARLDGLRHYRLDTNNSAGDMKSVVEKINKTY